MKHPTPPAAPGTPPDPAGHEGQRWVPPHPANPEGPVRRAVIATLGLTGAWNLLPAAAQRKLCDCRPHCRGEH